MTAAIQRAFAECLRAVGLEVEAVLADGLLHRCGTADRPRRAVRLFIEQHGASRFQDLDAPMSTCVNRVGFRRKDESGRTEFIILPESFRADVCKGFSDRRAARVLAEAGWLKLSQAGRLKCERRLPDLGKVRAYIVVLPEDDERE